MVNKTISINLDLKNVVAQDSKIPPLVVGDNGNIFVITLKDGNTPVDLSSCKVLFVVSRTSDGKTVEQDTEDAIIYLSDYGISVTGTPVTNDKVTVVLTDSTAVATVSGTGIQSASVDTDTFRAKVVDNGTYEFKYNGNDWQYGENSVQIGGTSHNVITINLKTSSFGEGKNNCEIQVYSGTNQSTLVTTAQFNFDGRPGIINEETIKTEEKYPLLVQLISIVSSLWTSLKTWIGVTATATRTEDAVAVSLTDVNGHKNFAFSIPTDVHIGDEAPTGQQSVWIRPDGTASEYVPQTRKINGYDLTQDRTLSDADIPSSDPNKTTRQYQATQDASISANTSNLTLESEGIYIPGDEKTTVFNADGSITVTFENGYSVKTVFNSDGSITDTLYDEDNTAVKYKTTTFNADGSISEVIEDA